MDNNYYKEYFVLERNHWWFIVRNKIIFLLIDKSLKNNPTTNLKVLNVGAATAKTSQLLEKYGEVTSLEYDKDCCAFVKEKLNIEMTNGSVLNLPYPDNYFDLVCAFDVIEHVEEDVLGITEMKRVCKKAGLIVASVPAFMTLWSQHDIVNHHMRRYTKSNFLQIFTANGLKANTITYFNTILFLPIFIFRLLTKIIPYKMLRNGAGSDATIMQGNKFLSSILQSIFSAELFLLKFIKFPFGVSIFISSTKD